MTYKLPEGWKEVKLGDVVVLNYGKALPQRNRVEGDIPVYSSAGITGNHNECLVKGPGIIVGRKGTIGTVYYEEEDFYCIDTAFYIKPNESYNFKYLYYLLLTLGLKNLNTDTAVPGLNRNRAYAQNIILPPLEEQKAIADTLSAIDDKIELNNKINENLEAQAQAIFKHWFVDFEFPDKDGNPYKSSGGEMVESELGMIPKGWEVAEINNYFDIAIGRTPPRKKTFYFSTKKKDMTWVSIKDLGKSGVFISESEEKLTDKAFEDFNIRIIPKDSVLMSFKLTIGRIAIANTELTTNEAIAHFINKKDNMTEYLYLYLKAFEFEKLGNTSSIGNAINSTIVKKMPFLYPDKKVLYRFYDIVNPLFKEIRNLQIQNQKLSQLRDTLLPKLMSGEIRIPLD